MKAGLTLVFVALFAINIMAQEGGENTSPELTYAANNTLTQNYIMHAADNNRFDTINRIMQNSYMNKFYKKYYKRPISYQNSQVQELIKRVRNSGITTGHSYPYANQIAIDPNVVSRLVNIVPRSTAFNRIDQKQQDLGKAYSNYNTAKKAYIDSYNKAQNNPINTNIDSIVASNEQALHDLKLRDVPTHTYSTPFGEPDKNMNVILNQIREMEHKVKQPLPAMLPNTEEITAMNRLSEKLNEVSKRIHQKPLEDLHQSAHAQDLMLERLSNLIRRMSNAVDDTRRDQFLNQLHAMIHKYHLHDEKFIDNLESEIGYALANNVPLQMPREAPSQGILSETDKAKAVSQNMEDYGKTLLSRSRELKNRADILERRTTVPNAEREELMDHIRTRLISPPAEVHAMGAQRPAYQYRV